MKNKSLKKHISLLLCLVMVLTTMFALPITANAVSTPTDLESCALSFWADPENTLTQQDIDDFSAGTKTTMVGAVGVFARSTSSDNYYLFLPSSSDCTNLKVWFAADSVTSTSSNSSSSIIGGWGSSSGSQSSSSTPTASVTVDGNTTTLVSGEATNVFADVNDGGISKTYTLTLNGTDRTLTVIKSGDVGTIYVDTTSGSMSTVNSSSEHTEYEAGTIMVIDADGNVNYDGALEKIQGRGNGTWSTSNKKNPYNVKLATSTSLLGMGKAKKWCLLANNNDTTLIKNQLTYDFADYIGINYQPHCKPVDVYVNQQYYGSYQLAEKVEIKSNRIGISDAYENLEIANGTTDSTTGVVTPADLSGTSVSTYDSSGKTATITIGTGADSYGSTVGYRRYSKSLTSPSDYTGGYLYELEISNRWITENAGFCAYNRQGWTMKSTDYASKDMVDYSYNLLYALGSSVYNGGIVPSKSTTTTCSSGKTVVRTTSNPAPATEYQGKSWSDLLDADSAVRYYWTQEYFKNMDSSTSSTYFYKESDSVDSKIYAGPMWDMDNSIGYDLSGSRWGYSWTDATGWYTKNTRIYRFYYSDSTTSYSSDSYAPLSFYGALATNCSDFWTQASSYWYTIIEPATQILLGNAEDPTGTLKSTEYYVNTVAKSNTMDNLRLELNSSSAWDYSSMVSGINNWFTTRNNWINSEIPQIDISNATFSTISNQPCTGSEIEPDFTLTYNGATLQEGIDYNVEYSNNVSASKNAQITVTGIGYYTGTKSTTFTISAGSLVGGTATISDTAYVGDTLDVVVTNSSGKAVNDYINYQWKANGTAIAGATDSTFTIDDSHSGDIITVSVSGDGTNIASVGITSNECAVSTENKPQGLTKSLASWNYDYTADSTALATADETGATYYYTATSGENANTAQLTASVNATSESKIKWSGTEDLYANDSTTITPDQSPVIGTSKTDGVAWGEYPYFQAVVSTTNYEDISVSAKLGGTKKAPRDWKLQYSIDGTNFIDVDGATYSIVDNKTMELAFNNVQLPSICNNKSAVYVRIVACSDVAINGVNTIVGQTSGDASINNLVITGTSTTQVETLDAPTIQTTSTNGDGTSLFNTESVSITDNNGGADVYYTVNGGEPVLYTGTFNPFDSETATKGDTAVIKAYASFNDIQSETTEFTVSFAGVDIVNWIYDDYSQNVSNGAVFSNGGVYDESAKMTAYTDGNSQYVPLWNSTNGAYSIAPDDGALWSEDSGFYFETSTAGYKNVSFTAKAYTTAQGPNSVSLEYSIDGSSWNTVQSNVALSANGTLNQVFLTAQLPDECANQTKVYVRLVTKENLTHGSDTTEQTKLHNKNSKGNLYINNVIISGDDNGDYKMPYTNKTTDYFGTGTIKYSSPSGATMHYAVTDSSSNTILSGVYPTDGISITSAQNFDVTQAGAYTVSVWAGDNDDQSLVNTRKYYYKGTTVTKFNYNDTKKLLANYLSEDGTSATNTSGANAGTLSMYPNGVNASTLSYTNTYGVKVSSTADNAFNATKVLDNPSGNGYWLVSTSSKGYTNLTLNLEQLSSNKGVRDWGLAYSLDGVDYTYISSSNVRAISNDSATSTVETYNNFKLPSECDNQDNLYIKVFINGGEAVNGKELVDVSAGNTGINAIELSGIAIPVAVDVTVNTVCLESANSISSTPVDATVTVNGNDYQTENGSVTLSLYAGSVYTISATVNGTFANQQKITVSEGDSITIPLVAVDVVADGVINAKDYAVINKLDNEQKDYYKQIFKNFVNVKQDDFSYNN